MDPDKENLNVAPEHKAIANSIAKERGLGETGSQVMKKGLENVYGEQKAGEVLNQVASSPDHSSEKVVDTKEEVKKAA